MSFVTKREHAFDDNYTLSDIPNRPECKLKAYSSCTDTRAWSHHITERSDHLSDLIKRNQAKCGSQLIPTDVIINTLMSLKNAELEKMKRRLDDLETILAAFSKLDLTPEQLAQIEKAYETIRAKNKELCLTCCKKGASSGDTNCGRNDCDTSTEVNVKPSSKGIGTGEDPRVIQLQGEVAANDAKVCAMQNTIETLEGEVCEPYCVYAHIFLALEKALSILLQSKKYKNVIENMISGKNNTDVDIKMKILFRIQILEKFLAVLTFPCEKIGSSSKRGTITNSDACYHAEISSYLKPTFGLTKIPKYPKSIGDDHRAKLVAEIVYNGEDLSTDEDFDDNSIDLSDNLARLKVMQNSYQGLLEKYEEIVEENKNFKKRLEYYDTFDKEFEELREALRTYSILFKEKEHYRKRLEEIENEREKYFILLEEASLYEKKYHKECEINSLHKRKVSELNSLNIHLEKKVSEINFERQKERNELFCRIKEMECRLMSQDQEIKTLLNQIEKFISYESQKATLLQDKDLQICQLEKQIANLKEIVLCSEERLKKQRSQSKNIINSLKEEIDSLKELSTNAKMFEKDVSVLKQQFEKKCLVKSIFQDNTQSENYISEDLKDLIKEKNEEIEVLDVKLINKIDENEKLTSSLNSTLFELCKLKKEINETNELRNRMSKDLEEVACVCKNLKSDLDKKIKETEYLEKSIRDLKHQNSLLIDKQNINGLAKVNQECQTIVLQNDEVEVTTSGEALKEEDDNYFGENSQCASPELNSIADGDDSGACDDINDFIHTREAELEIAKEHIINLTDEIKALQNSFNFILNYAEEMHCTHTKYIEDSIEYTHALEKKYIEESDKMKMKLVKLQNELDRSKQTIDLNTGLQEKLQTQVAVYKTEMKNIVEIIKKIDLDEEDIFVDEKNPLEIIKKSVEFIARRLLKNNSMNAQLELTLQTSSKMLLTKANEAQKILQQEKLMNQEELNILREEKNHMEREHIKQIEKLQFDIMYEKNKSKDLEVQLINEKKQLLNEKLLSSMLHENLQNSYNETKELNQQIEYLTKLKNDLLTDNTKNQQTIVNITDIVKIKTNKVEQLTNELANLKKYMTRSSSTVAIQTLIQLKMSSVRITDIQPKSLPVLNQESPEDSTNNLFKEKEICQHSFSNNNDVNRFYEDSQKFRKFLNEVEKMELDIGNDKPTNERETEKKSSFVLSNAISETNDKEINKSLQCKPKSEKSTIEAALENRWSETLLSGNEPLKLLSKYRTLYHKQKKSIGRIEREYKRNIDSLKSNFCLEIQDLNCRHEDEIHELKSKNELIVKDITLKYDSEIFLLKKTLSLENDSLKKQLKHLQETLNGERREYVQQIRTKKSVARLTRSAIIDVNITTKKYSHGPCTCTLDMNLQDPDKSLAKKPYTTTAAQAIYIKHIACKLLSGLVDDLSLEELTVLHFYVCKVWKVRLCKKNNKNKGNKIKGKSCELCQT